MSVTQITSQMQQSDYLQCKRCYAALPISATFCGKCGERVDREETHSSNMPISGQNDITTRYRITSLVRRRPAIQLSFALDTQQQRPIVLRDIDISGLEEAAREQACAEFQQEYDLLQGQQITDVMPLIASSCYEGHLYSIASWPFPLHEKEPNDTVSGIRSRRPYTLQDLLQSGIGLPEEQIAISWIGSLAQAVEGLHEHQIIIGELDPDTVIVSSHDYSGQPALMVSWIPTRIRRVLSQVLNTASPSSFRAPETLYGQEGVLTDIYSLGALLYLLLSGTAPEPVGSSIPKRYPLRSPRDFNPHISSTLDAIVMRALALEPDKRFQRASLLAEALLHLEKKQDIVRRPQITFIRPPKSSANHVEETVVSSDMDNNETDRSKEALPIEAPNDETIRIRDIQAQLAQRYLSRVNNGALGSQEKQTGDAIVDEVHIQEEDGNAVENKNVSNQAPKEISTNKEEDIKKSKKRRTGKSQVINGHTPEAASSSEVEDEIVQPVAPSTQEVELLAESSDKVPPQQAPVDALPEETLIASFSESAPEVQTSSELAELELSAEQPQITVAKEEITVHQEKSASQQEVSAQQELAQSQAEVSTHQEERPPEVSQEKYAAPTSQALVPQSSSHSRMLPALQPGGSRGRALARIRDLFVGTLSPLTLQTPPKEVDANKDISLLQRVQRFILGEQKHTTTAAALIETPMRVQPAQSYAIRVHIIGRNQLKDETQTGGLSALAHGDIAHIEVRLAVYQSYAYMVQQAEVEVPASGYAAEVTMPMHPLSCGPSSRRERLHIFFMDRDHNALYEKPFVIEIFVSPLVQLGNEGHNVLSIPM